MTKPGKKLAVFLGVLLSRNSAATTPQRATPALRANPVNPNRSMSCLVAANGSPISGYVPSSDSIVFDTGACGSCGVLNEVCDLILVDAYRAAGMELSDLNTLPRSGSLTNKLTRLRFRRDPMGADHGCVIEDTSLDSALERSQPTILWQRLQRQNSQNASQKAKRLRVPQSGKRRVAFGAKRARANIQRRGTMT